ncbi:MAG: hypothetical protein ACQETI_01360 [Halobacteriota archaeon]
MTIREWNPLAAPTLAVLSILVLLYAVLVVGQLLLGVLLVVAIGVLWWLARTLLGDVGVGAAFTPIRAVATVGVIVVVVVYSFFVIREVLLGVAVSILIFFAAWLTSPAGPLLTGDGS